jgi:peptide/nickel transport system ATP-binding protein
VTTVLELEDLVVEYRASGRVRALDGASLTVKSGESWGIVGESGWRSPARSQPMSRRVGA